ncbi:MAG: Bro-N domain-containing protein, partial [Candidatus Omnitrophica bacterium]|nr:Bro-N domain-containing protein [Candidatus Omnitrophota bacterium]
MSKDKDTKMAIFKGKQVRRIIHNNEWWFSIIDVIEVLTGTERSRKYWSDLKQKLVKEGYVEVSEKIGQLKLQSPDGKMRETDCANTEGIFRLIQSIPSPKAEPFKRWLAKVGYERIQEIENPELATQRTRVLYKLKGYSDDWIEKRMR